MDAPFWHNRWETNEISFHKDEANPLLVEHFNALSLENGSRVFIPLCGKTRDIAWLLSNGYRVAGAELSRIAVGQLFDDLGVEVKISREGELDHYQADSIDVFAGDIFALTRNLLGPVDAIYDRAALVALPREMRSKYTLHLREITNTAPQLLICYEYDQALMDGPPFSVTDAEVERHYKDRYELNLITRFIIPGGLKGKAEARENVWVLKNS
jgi:thiopurine S-methyltransferase